MGSQIWDGTCRSLTLSFRLIRHVCFDVQFLHHTALNGCKGWLTRCSRYIAIHALNEMLWTISQLFMKCAWCGMLSCDCVISRCVWVVEASVLPPKAMHSLTGSIASATVHLTAPTPQSCPGHCLCIPEDTHTHTLQTYLCGVWIRTLPHILTQTRFMSINCSF